MEEQWEPIEGYDHYEVSNYGNVRSYTNRGTLCAEPHMLSPRLNKGYLFVNLYDSQHKMKSIKVHRLVASAFIPNPDNYPQINHKDEDKTNNHVDNLEWCDSKYNVNYGTGHARSCYARRDCNNKEVHQFDFNGQYIQSFKSITEASRITGCCLTDISKAALHSLKYAGNWFWSYTMDYDFSKEINTIGRISYWKNSQIINQYDKKGNFIKSYTGFNEVEQILNHPKYNMYNIVMVCRGNRETWHGYKWAFGRPTYQEYLAQLNSNNN